MANVETHGRAKPPDKRKPAIETKPDKFTYALRTSSAERRSNGWFVAQTQPSFTGNKIEWRGPFATIESACLAIARGLAVEIADRHTRSVEAYKIDRKHALRLSAGN